MTNISDLDLSTLAQLWSKQTDERKEINAPIRELLLEKIKTNTKYSRELIVRSIDQGKTFNIYFVPESKSYAKYGDYVTILYVDELENSLLEIRENIQANIDSYGNVMLSGRKPKSTLEEAIDIDTFDILNLEHR